MACCFVLVNNSSCATIHYMVLQSLNNSRQVAAFQKYQHLKICTLASCPPPPPYALYEYIHVDNCERPLTDVLLMARLHGQFCLSIGCLLSTANKIGMVFTRPSNFNLMRNELLDGLSCHCDAITRRKPREAARSPSSVHR